MGMVRSLVAALAVLLASSRCCAVASPNAYITNFSDNTVSVLATPSNTVIGSPIPVGPGPSGVAVTPDGSKVYITNYNVGDLAASRS
jgi:YVTN family beta-propeller protein